MTELNWDKGHGTLQQDNYRGWVVEAEPFLSKKYWHWRAKYTRQSHGDVHTGMSYGTRQTEQEAKAAAVAAVDATEDAGLLREIGCRQYAPGKVTKS